jgi:protein SCO1/2
MRRCSKLALAVAVTALAFAACRREAAPSKGGSRHPLRGKVVAVDAAKRTLTIAHDEIPGFMAAMTMDFVVLEKDAPLLAAVGAGDDVTATLVMPDSRYWLEDLVVLKKGTPDPKAKGPRVYVAEPGIQLPDVMLFDQDGRPLRLSDLRGRAYAVTFVFTRCPLPEFCPLLMRNFAAAEALILSDPLLRERTRLLTVSFDTKHDTPDVLRAFGKPFQKTRPPFTHWVLATGTADSVRVLAEALELEYVEESASYTHNLRTAVVNPQGWLSRLFRGNDWQPRELVAALTAAARQSR